MSQAQYKQKNLHSMTGFGRSTVANKKYRISVEIRSVNGRYLEVRTKLPRAVSFIESSLRELAGEYLRRGVVDITITLQTLSANMEEVINQKVASSYAKAITGLAKKEKIETGLTVMGLLRLPGVLSAEENTFFVKEEELLRLLKKCTEQALKQLIKTRAQEGEKLSHVFLRELAGIKKVQQQIFESREKINERYKEKLQTRLSKFSSSGAVKFDDSRLLQEVAYYLDRSDVMEELDRLASHLKQFFSILEGKEEFPVGKRLDFLAQEMGREMNTIGAKSDALVITNCVMQMKICLERIREQIQNVE